MLAPLAARARRRGAEAAQGLIEPDVVWDFALGRAHARWTPRAKGLAVLFVSLFVIFFVNGSVFIPTGLLALYLVNQVRPVRGVAVTDHDVVVLSYTVFRPRPDKVIARASLSALTPTAESAASKAPKLVLGEDRISIRRVDYERLAAARDASLVEAGSAPAKAWPDALFAPHDAPVAPDDEPTAKIPLIGLPIALGGVVVASIVSVMTGLLTRAMFPHNGAMVVLVAQLALWAVLVATCMMVSQRYGTGSLAADFGFSFRLSDIGPGLGYLCIGWVSIAVVATLLPRQPVGGHGNTELAQRFVDHLPGFLVVSMIAVIGAPIIEELFFRGLLLRSLKSRLAPVTAIAIQAVLFGAAHIVPTRDAAGNVRTFILISTLGAVLGYAAHRSRRLGPGMTAHATQNLVAMTVVFFRR